MKKFLFSLQFIFLPLLAPAQTPYWHQTSGPPAGNISNITIDSAGRVFIWSAGSGAFISTDTGKTWGLYNRGLPSPQLLHGAATKSGYLIATNSQKSAQLFRRNANDPNSQWEEITPDTGLTINFILADPSGPVYIAFGDSGVWRSDDNGKTWAVKKVLKDTVDPPPNILVDKDIDYLSIDGNGNLFCGLHANGAFYRSSDKGVTWTKLPARNPDLHKTLSALLALPNGNILIGTQLWNFNVGGHIFVSTDTGRTWKATYERPYTSEDGKNNIDKLILVPGTNVIYANVHGPTLRSTDSGMTWDTTDNQKRGDEPFTMAARGNILFQMAEPDGVFLSIDNGKNWTERDKGIRATVMYGVALNSKQHLFGITEYGLWSSIDNGDTWKQKPEYGEDYSPSIFIDKQDYIFIGTSKGLWRSVDEGQTLKRVIIRQPDGSIIDQTGWIDHIEDNKQTFSNKKLFVSSKTTDIGFLSSSNEGDSWDTINIVQGVRHILQPEVTAFAIGSGGDTIIAATGAGYSVFYQSIDGGVSWNLVPGNPNLAAAQLLIHPKGFYLARYLPNGIYLSSDGAQTWGKIFPPADWTVAITKYFYMLIDHNGDIIVCTDSGIYKTQNGNLANWISVSDGLSANDVPGHFVSARGVVENPVTHVFFAATFGLGVFKSIPNLSGVSILPAAADNISVYPNPLSGSATISCNVENSGEISLELFDVLGRKVRTIFSGRATAGKKEIAFDAKSLPAGSYVLAFSVGEKISTMRITVIK